MELEPDSTKSFTTSVVDGIGLTPSEHSDDILEFSFQKVMSLAPLKTDEASRFSLASAILEDIAINPEPSSLEIHRQSCMGLDFSSSERELQVGIQKGTGVEAEPTILSIARQSLLGLDLFANQKKNEMLSQDIVDVHPEEFPLEVQRQSCTGMDLKKLVQHESTFQASVGIEPNPIQLTVSPSDALNLNVDKPHLIAQRMPTQCVNNIQNFRIHFC